MRGGRVDFAATERSRNPITGQFFVKGCHRLWSVTERNRGSATTASGQDVLGQRRPKPTDRLWPVSTPLYRGEADKTQPKIHEDENADHQKGEAMDSRLLAIAYGFREGIGKVREAR